MSSRKMLRVTIGEAVAAPRIWEMSEIDWHDGKMACPKCKQFVEPQPILDIIQYGLFRGDNCYTVFFCEHTEQYYAVHYENLVEGD